MRCTKTDMNSHLQPPQPSFLLFIFLSFHTLRPFTRARALKAKVSVARERNSTVRLLQFWSETTAGATFYSRGGRSRGGKRHTSRQNSSMASSLTGAANQSAADSNPPLRARTPSSSSSVDDSRDAARWEWIKRCCKRLEICSLQGNKMTAVPPSWMAKVGWFARAWHVFKWEFIHKCASRASPCMQEQRSSSWLFFFSKSKHVVLKQE